MGGVSQAYSDFQSVNFTNPASYSNLKLVTYDVAIEGGVKKIGDGEQSFSSGIGNLSYIQLGIPIRNKWGAVLGIRPMSKVSYNVTRTEERIFFDTLQMPVLYQYEGNGGVYQAYLGTGFGFGGFSVGANIGYLFGNIENSTKTIYSVEANTFPSKHSRRTSYQSLFYNLGLQYEVKFNKEVSMVLAATGNFEQKLKARREQLRETLYYDASSDDYGTQDTVSYSSGDRGDIVYPRQLGGGIMFKKIDKWQIGADFTTGAWSQYRNYGDADSTRDAWKFAVGGQFTPNLTALKGYWNKVTYRLGGYYGQDYIKIGGEDMPMLGVTVGAGFPVRRMLYSNQFSVVNLSFEVGRRGNNNTVLKENFYRVGLGFTLSDRWFIKQKYD
ncbi:hypothetical protein MKQ68_20970 [Chitinophaga horti]|uniref:Long-chain fatty acid transport protein n=1 Tax=Chitinophaga horti TaxID=2920382 RepID=A0ABY6IZ53_9BACT|nr:hypothetical protein [Chitinophaga horti]UYQ92560.1 hypothetical protein MKQ68_20970 [Chitinophaga horti]